MKFNISFCGERALAAALLVGTAAALATPAAAQPIFGGGATLPGEAIRNLLDCYGVNVLDYDPNTGGRQEQVVTTPPIDCTTVAQAGSTFLYTAVGSREGVRSLITENAPTALHSSGTLFPATAPSAPDYPYPDWHFALSVAPLVAANVDGYNVRTAAANGPILQVPLFGTPITLAFNGPGGGLTLANPTPPGGSSGLQLRRRDYCAIFGGYITDWSDEQFNFENEGQPLSAGLAITRVTRSDRSGTTLLLTSRLAAQCATTAFPFDLGSDNFIDWNVRGNPVVAAEGDEGVATALNDTATAAGRIGYLSPAFALPASDNFTNVVTANLQTFADPLAFVPPSPAATAASIASIRAPAADLRDDPLAWSALQATEAGALREPVRPEAAGAYPLAGFVYADLYTCYATAQRANRVRGFLRFVLLNSPNVANILQANGFAPLPNQLRNVTRSVAVNEPTTSIRTAPVTGVCDTGA